MGLTSEEKLAIERRFAENQLRHADPITQRKWEATSSGHRFVAYKGKSLVAFRVMFGQPTVLKTLTLVDVSMDFSNGMTTTWVDADNRPLIITHTPYEVAEGCFLWHNKLSNLEYTEHLGKYSMRFAMTWRTALSPKKLVDGKVYLLESSVFNSFIWDSAKS